MRCFRSGCPGGSASGLYVLDDIILSRNRLSKAGHRTLLPLRTAAVICFSSLGVVRWSHTIGRRVFCSSPDASSIELSICHEAIPLQVLCRAAIGGGISKQFLCHQVVMQSGYEFSHSHLWLVLMCLVSSCLPPVLTVIYPANRYTIQD